MSDNELRDRIATIISDVICPGHGGYILRENTEAAQAIIDDLGLTVETHAATHAKRNMTRIISAWEWGNQ